MDAYCRCVTIAPDPSRGSLKTAQGSTRRSFCFLGPRDFRKGHAQSKPPVCFCKRAARGQSGLWGLTPEGLVLRRRLVVRRRRAILVLRHERVELFLVLGVTQARQEILELLLLLLETAQRFGAVLVEGAVA